MWSRRYFLSAMASVFGAVFIADTVYSVAHRISPKGIVVHHSALPPDETLEQIAALHRDRGFGAFYWWKHYTIGYHYVISADGHVNPIRPEHLRGAHAKGSNDMLGICMLGNFQSSESDLQPTQSQMRALASLCADIMNRYSFTAEQIHRHSDVDSYTVCPGDRFPFVELKEQIANRLSNRSDS